MAYIGNEPSVNFTSFAKQDITGDGTANYTLTYAVANANEIEVFVNNVRQEPSVAYTVSGTALSMTGNVASTDDFYVIYLGKALQTTVPPDGSVSTAKIADDAVTSAKLVDSAVTNAKIANSTIDLTTKITGTLPVANGGTGNIIKPYFKLQKSGNQATPNGATVTVTWETTVYDTASIVDLTDNRVNITSATEGLWYVQANIMTDTLNFRQVVDLRKNGSGLARFERATQTVANNGSRAPNISANTIVEVANGDYLDVSYISVNGTNNISNAASGTYFYGWRIT
jgi:hypothetical protein